jgi:hypothetical protein
MKSAFDPFVERLGRDWLIQYARLIRIAPELVTRLRDREDEFELVPVPRPLVDALATPFETFDEVEADVSGPMRTLEFLGWSPTIPFTDFGPQIGIDDRQELAGLKPGLDGLIREILVGLEQGDLDRVMAGVSPSYADEEGRGPDELRKSLEQFVELSRSRRLIALGARSPRVSERQLLVSAALAWEARLADEKGGGEPASGIALIELAYDAGDARWAAVGMTGV